MTPEALRDYLVGRGFTEDVAQDVIVSYLTTKSKVRDPHAWGVKAALHLTMRYAKGPTPSEAQADHLQAPLPTQGLVGHEPSPLRVAMARQELARIFAQRKPKLGHNRHPIWGYRARGYEGCWEDYQALVTLAGRR